MKSREKRTGPQRITVIDIDLTRGLLAALFCVLLGVSLLAYLALTGERAVASETGTSGVASSAQSTGKRWFYLTKAKFRGDEALTACAPGYHMAAIWEIADPSNLKYNTTLGYTAPEDTGQGPSNLLLSWGWVRTGYSASTSETIGQGNCDAWSTADWGSNGSMAKLPSDWVNDEKDVGVWDTSFVACSNWKQVWCIKD